LPLFLLSAAFLTTSRIIPRQSVLTYPALLSLQFVPSSFLLTPPRCTPLPHLSYSHSLMLLTLDVFSFFSRFLGSFLNVRSSVEGVFHHPENLPLPYLTRPTFIMNFLTVLSCLEKFFLLVSVRNALQFCRIISHSWSLRTCLRV